MYEGTMRRITLTISSEALQATRECNKIFKMLTKQKPHWIHHLRILYQERRIIFKSEVEIKFSQ
jgi:hypothetical protein